MLERRQFLRLTLGSGILARPAIATGATRICLVARSADRTTDMPGIFSELGLSHEVVALEDSPGLSPDGCSLLWIGAPQYPEPAALPAGLVAVAESVLAGGGGVFTEFITNCPGVPARAEMLKSGVAACSFRAGWAFPTNWQRARSWTNRIPFSCRCPVRRMGFKRC